MSNSEHERMSMTPGSMSMDNSPGDHNTMNVKTMMQMSFYWGKDAIILFCGWPDQQFGMYILALFFVFFLAAAVEVLSVHQRGANKTGTNVIAVAATLAFVYGLKVVLAYFVMLSVMSFNVGVLIAAVVGHAFGFFVVTARALAMENRPAAANFTDDVTSKV